MTRPFIWTIFNSFNFISQFLSYTEKLWYFLFMYVAWLSLFILPRRFPFSFSFIHHHTDTLWWVWQKQFPSRFMNTEEVPKKYQINMSSLQQIQNVRYNLKWKRNIRHGFPPDLHTSSCVYNLYITKKYIPFLFNKHLSYT